MSRETSVAQFTLGLRSRQNEVRLRNAIQLQRFLSNDLRSMASSEASELLDELNRKHIAALCSSNETHERKGGVLALSEY